MAEKLFYTMGEVSELFDVNPSLLRYWEEQFPKLRPKRNKKGNRLYTPQDVELLKTIYHLVKERGMKIEGARRALREEHRPGSVARNAELTERLQRIRALLVEVREELKANGDERIDGAAPARNGSESAASEAAAPAVPAPLAEDPAAPAAAVAAASAAAPAAAAPASASASASTEAETAPASEEGPASRTAPAPGGKSRRPRRKKEEVENKELFAFYEQSLF